MSQPTFDIVSQHPRLGGALLGATVGEIVEVHLPQGVDRVRIFDIRFPDGKGYPVTARPMTERERQRHQQWPKTMNQLPDTDSITALAEFWQTHDPTDFENALVEVTEPVFQHAERLSVILPAEDLGALRARARLEHTPETALVSKWIHERLHAG